MKKETYFQCNNSNILEIKKDKYVELKTPNSYVHNGTVPVGLIAKNGLIYGTPTVEGLFEFQLDKCYKIKVVNK